MAQLDTRTEAMFGQFHASKGLAEYRDTDQSRSAAGDRALKELGGGVDENVVMEPDMIELHASHFGRAPDPYTVDELPLTEALKKIRRGNIDEMLVALESLDSQYQTHVQENTPGDVMDLAEALLTLANDHENRRVREAAANCGLSFVAHLRAMARAGSEN
jgi:hypothetical protein